MKLFYSLALLITLIVSTPVFAQCVDDFGCSTVSAPNPPTNVSVPSTDSDGTFNVTWSQSSGGAMFY